MVGFVSFVALVAVLVLIPGPAVLLVVQRAVSQGFRSALAASLGVLTADLVWAVAAALGVTAVLVASEPAFLALRLLGAAYLAYLGLRLLLSHPGALLPTEGTRAAGGGRPLVAFRQGFVCDMTNPKTVVAFTSVIPQFLGSGDDVAMAALLGVTFALLGFASLMLYAAVFSGTTRLLGRPRWQRLFARGSGVALVGFGVALAVESVEG